VCSVPDLARVLSKADPKSPAGSLHNAGQELDIEVTGKLDSVARVAAISVEDDGDGGLLAP